jgi:CheY-like chemotaxis protein
VANVRLIHWNGPEGRERKLRLASLGHHVEFDHVEGPGLSRVLRASQPDAYVIDLTRMPSNGRQVAMWLRSTKTTRHIPIVFVDGDPEKVARLKELLPDATYTSWPRLKTALPKAIGRQILNPVVPPSSIYTGRPTVEKLGVKPGMTVCLINAPKGFAELLKPLPDGVRLTARESSDCGLFIAVVRSRRELATHVERLARDVVRQTLWIVWPKKASGIKTDLNGNDVRETGLGSGWVDFKVCAIDDTWSGLAFKRRNR